MRELHRLEKEIVKHGFTQASFCRKSGLCRWTLYDLFSGKTGHMKPFTVQVIADTLGEEFDTVWEWCERGAK